MTNPNYKAPDLKEVRARVINRSIDRFIDNYQFADNDTERLRADFTAYEFIRRVSNTPDETRLLNQLYDEGKTDE